MQLSSLRFSGQLKIDTDGRNYNPKNRKLTTAEKRLLADHLQHARQALQPYQTLVKLLTPDSLKLTYIVGINPEKPIVGKAQRGTVVQKLNRSISNDPVLKDTKVDDQIYPNSPQKQGLRTRDKGFSPQFYSWFHKQINNAVGTIHSGYTRFLTERLPSESIKPRSKNQQYQEAISNFDKTQQLLSSILNRASLHNPHSQATLHAMSNNYPTGQPHLERFQTAIATLREASTTKPSSLAVQGSLF